MKKDFPFTFVDVLNWTGAQHLLGRKSTPMSGVSIDSRSIKSGELFVAIKGPRFNGNDFLDDAVRRGTSAVLVNQMPKPAKLDQWRKDGLAVGLVDQGEHALQSMARLHRKRFSIPVIGITGSCGKTTTKEITHKFLEELGPVLKNEGTLNNHLGVPLTLLRLRTHHRVCCVEMGTSGQGEIAQLVAMASPTTGVILNIGPAHLKMLGDLNGVLAEKWTLMESLVGRSGGIGIINEDDPLLKERSQEYSGPLMTYGIYRGGDVQASKIEFLKNQSMRFSLSFQGTNLGIVRVPFIGLNNVYNVLAGMCIAHSLGVKWDQMIKMAANLELPSMRWEMKRVQGMLVINDAYNANPQSMSSALETFRALKVDGKKIFLCGDMLDLGSEEHHWHRQLAYEVVQAGIDVLITVGPLAAFMAEEAVSKGFSKNACFTCESQEEALRALFRVLAPSNAILIKGSRAMGLERISDAFIESFQKEKRGALAEQ